MKSTLFFGALALATAANATSVQLIKNYCNVTTYLTLTKDDGSSSGPFDLPAGQAFLNEITGTGNDAKLSFDSNIFTPETPIFILGTSTDQGILYWSVSNSQGDPFEGRSWNVTSDGATPDVCSHTGTYDTNVHACQDKSVTLTLNACWLNATA